MLASDSPVTPTRRMLPCNPPEGAQNAHFLLWFYNSQPFRRVFEAERFRYREISLQCSRLRRTLGQHPGFHLAPERSPSAGPPSAGRLDGSPEDGAHRNDAAKFVGRYGGQTHACDASARLTVRVLAEPAVFSENGIGTCLRSELRRLGASCTRPNSMQKIIRCTVGSLAGGS